MSLRTDKVSQQMQRELGELLQQGVNDERIGFVTVTSVDVSRDLRNAKVYVTILEDRKARNKTFQGLKSASGYLAGEVANRMNLKYAPRFTFWEDKGALHAYRIEEILGELNQEKPSHDEELEDEQESEEE